MKPLRKFQDRVILRGSIFITKLRDLRNHQSQRKDHQCAIHLLNFIVKSFIIATVIPCLVPITVVNVIKEVINFEVMEVVTYLFFEVVKHLIQVVKLIDVINSAIVTTFGVKKLIVTKDSFMLGHLKDFKV